MQELEDDELIDYVFGSLPEDRAREIEREAESDRELEAKIAVVATIASASRGATATSPLAPEHGIAGVRTSAGGRRRRTLLVAAVCLASLAGISFAGWAILHDPPLLSDNFNDRSFDAYLWMDQPEVNRRFNEPMGISEKNGYLKLVNRGYLITREEFRGPISLSLDWQWVELGPHDPRYAENLTVALRTTGRVSPNHPYEIEDGIRIMFNVWGPFVNVVQRISGEDTVLGSTEEPGPLLKLPIPADEWHKIRLTDDGETIAVYMSGPEIDEKYAKTPLLTVRCTQKFEKYHIAIYNRELVGHPHESLIDNVVIRALPRIQ